MVLDSNNADSVRLLALFRGKRGNNVERVRRTRVEPVGDAHGEKWKAAAAVAWK